MKAAYYEKTGRAKDVLKGELRDTQSVAIAPVPLHVYRAKWFSENVEFTKSSSSSCPFTGTSPSTLFPTAQQRSKLDKNTLSCAPSPSSNFPKD